MGTLKESRNPRTCGCRTSKSYILELTFIHVSLAGGHLPVRGCLFDSFLTLINVSAGGRATPREVQAARLAAAEALHGGVGHAAGGQRVPHGSVHRAHHGRHAGGGGHHRRAPDRPA
eukprot:412637-Prorocentrum_minimum.AAC.1